MTLFRRFGLPERLLAILLLVAGIDFAANTLLFDRASRFALREDDAARVAENLVLASRSIERTPLAERDRVARDLSTPRFSMRWRARRAKAAGSVTLATMRDQILAVSPELGEADLQLQLKGIGGSGNVIGTMVLRDRSILEFETYASAAWTLNAGRIATLLLPTIALTGLAWVLFSATLAPLRTLVRATRKVGAGPPDPVAEEGTGEVRELIRAFNQMQQRVYQSMTDRTQSMLAIGHDLRTPLSRMQLRLENVAIDEETRAEMDGDLEEMRHMLESLQAFVETGGSRLRPERIDLAVMAQTLVDTAADQGGDATYHGAESIEIMARPVSLRRALSNLVENALHYAGNVRVTVNRDGAMAEIRVEDDGPGIPAEQLADAVQPFTRLDAARGRDTPGMGLGLAIVARAVELEQGTLALRNRDGGGLSVVMRIPCAAD